MSAGDAEKPSNGSPESLLLIQVQQFPKQIEIENSESRSRFD